VEANAENYDITTYAELKEFVDLTLVKKDYSTLNTPGRL
jgi:hypothetical protein